LRLFPPRRFTEKVQWRKLFDLDPIYPVFCDKVATRKYVTEHLYPGAALPILWAGRDPFALPFDKLRPPYILKCSHGAGWNIVVREGEVVNRDAVCTKLQSWLATDFGILMDEPGYSPVPRQLLVEPLLTYRGSPPLEYRFFVFDGVVRLVMHYDSGREGVHISYYDALWKHLRLRTSDRPWTEPVPRPEEFDSMREMAEKLAGSRDFIRVDFLVDDTRVYVGELTLYHRSGLFAFDPDEFDFVLGAWWRLRRPIWRALRTIAERDWGIPVRQGTDE
jgi:hypothetical protein